MIFEATNMRNTTGPIYHRGSENNLKGEALHNGTEEGLQLRRVTESEFYDNVLEGNQIKEIVKVLLEKSGYLVLPYGYESTLSGLINKLGVKDTKKTRTVRRIKSSPDLLVFDDKRKDLMLVEVKMRKAPAETRIFLSSNKIANYKEFWNDSILVIVVPCGSVFYAQRIGELEGKDEYNALLDFEKFENVFTGVKEEDLSHFKARALQIMKK